MKRLTFSEQFADVSMRIKNRSASDICLSAEGLGLDGLWSGDYLVIRDKSKKRNDRDFPPFVFPPESGVEPPVVRDIVLKSNAETDLNYRAYGYTMADERNLADIKATLIGYGCATTTDRPVLDMFDLDRAAEETVAIPGVVVLSSERLSFSSAECRQTAAGRVCEWNN